MKTDWTRSLIEASVRYALNKCGESPERESRNLVDLGLQFSSGELQKHILGVVQSMLQDPDCAYYEMVRDALANTSHDRLLTFGVNLGYEGCSKGAEVIRKTEAEGGFNIPWAMAIELSAEELDKRLATYESLLLQGASMGIRTYLLFSKGDMSPFIPVVKAQEKSAFVLSLWPAQVTQRFIASLENVPNVMVAVRHEDGAGEACALLREAKIPYAVLMEYSDGDRQRIVSGKWIESLLPMHPILALLIPSRTCSEDTQSSVYEYVQSVRQAQRYPVVPMELKRDIMRIDHYISGDTCFVAFDSQGQLNTDAGVFEGEEYNVFSRELRDILRLALRKN